MKHRILSVRVDNGCPIAHYDDGARCDASDLFNDILERLAALEGKREDKPRPASGKCPCGCSYGWSKDCDSPWSQLCGCGATHQCRLTAHRSVVQRDAENKPPPPDAVRELVAAVREITGHCTPQGDAWCRSMTRIAAALVAYDEAERKGRKP